LAVLVTCAMPCANLPIDQGSAGYERPSIARHNSAQILFPPLGPDSLVRATPTEASVSARSEVGESIATDASSLAESRAALQPTRLSHLIPPPPPSGPTIHSFSKSPLQAHLPAVTHSL